MTGITQNVTKTSKQLAIDAAKRTAREPYEILKSIPKQVVGVPEKLTRPLTPEQAPQDISSGGRSDGEQVKAKLHAQSVRQMQALEAELSQIRQMKMQEKAQEVQEEEIREEQQKAQVPGAPPQIVSKPKRGLLAGIGKGRRKLSQLQQSTGTSRVEFRKPPSG